MNDTLSPLDAALAWFDDGHNVAIATVIDTWGSSPRPVGSQIAIRDDQHFVGSVSGGCIENAVIQAALQVMQTQQAQMMEFLVSDELAWNTQLACGGAISVYVEPLLHT
ncbi:MAG: XdhC family protein [Pseudomonadota bacterium]